MKGGTLPKNEVQYRKQMHEKCNKEDDLPVPTAKQDIPNMIKLISILPAFFQGDVHYANKGKNTGDLNKITFSSIVAILYLYDSNEDKLSNMPIYRHTFPSGAKPGLNNNFISSLFPLIQTDTYLNESSNSALDECFGMRHQNDSDNKYNIPILMQTVDGTFSGDKFTWVKKQSSYTKDSSKNFSEIVQTNVKLNDNLRKNLPIKNMNINNNTLHHTALVHTPIDELLTKHNDLKPEWLNNENLNTPFLTPTSINSTLSDENIDMVLVASKMQIHSLLEEESNKLRQVFQEPDNDNFNLLDDTKDLSYGKDYVQQLLQPYLGKDKVTISLEPPPPPPSKGGRINQNGGDNEKPINRETVDGQQCYAFTYKGTEYTDCTSKDGKDGKEWCATAPNYGKGSEAYGYCKPAASSTEATLDVELANLKTEIDNLVLVEKEGNKTTQLNVIKFAELSEKLGKLEKPDLTPEQKNEIKNLRKALMTKMQNQNKEHAAHLSAIGVKTHENDDKNTKAMTEKDKNENIINEMVEHAKKKQQEAQEELKKHDEDDKKDNEELKKHKQIMETGSQEEKDKAKVQHDKVAAQLAARKQAREAAQQKLEDAKAAETGANGIRTDINKMEQDDIADNPIMFRRHMMIELMKTCVNHQRNCDDKGAGMAEDCGACMGQFSHYISNPDQHMFGDKAQSGGKNKTRKKYKPKLKITRKNSYK